MSGGQPCECAACGEVFAGLGLFDAHQDWDYRRVPQLICRDPAAVTWHKRGLVKDGHGRWTSGAGTQGAAMAMARDARNAYRQAAEFLASVSQATPGGSGPLSLSVTGLTAGSGNSVGR